MLGRFLLGLRYCLRGVRFVFVEHPTLIRYSAVSALITMLVAIGALWCVWIYAPELTDSVWKASADPGGWGIADRVLHGVVRVLLTVVLALIAVALSVVLSSVVAAPFNDALSQRVELMVHGQVGSPGWRSAMRDFWRTLSLEVVKVLTFAAVMAPLLLLSFLVPGPGQVLYALISFFFSAYYMAIDFIDWPASRRDYSLADRIRLWRGWSVELLGFGVGVWLLLWVPVINFWLMPAAVAGGTLLFLDVFEKNTKNTK